VALRLAGAILTPTVVTRPRWIVAGTLRVTGARTLRTGNRAMATSARVSTPARAHALGFRTCPDRMTVSARTEAEAATATIVMPTQAPAVASAQPKAAAEAMTARFSQANSAPLENAPPRKGLSEILCEWRGLSVRGCEGRDGKDHSHDQEQQ